MAKLPLIVQPEGVHSAVCLDRDGVLFVSYYSSHEGKTCIYMAKVSVD